jgi:uncharacterized protein (DUF305 family)
MTRIPVRRAVLAGAGAFSALLILAACGGDDNAGGTTRAGGTATAVSPAGGTAFNDADVVFAQMMIPHHEQAIQMAELAESRASDPEIKQIAARVKEAQQPEITTMTGWLTAWGKPAATTDGGHGMTGMSSVPGEMSEEDMAKMQASRGADFDRMFAEMMIDHHNGAIQMARDEQAKGSNPDGRALAAQIEKTQAAEVVTLQKVLDRL